MAGKLTKAQWQVLKAADGRTIRQLYRMLDMPMSSISMVRNLLVNYGLIAPWANYEEPMRLTPAGREALANKGGGHG